MLLPSRLVRPRCRAFPFADIVTVCASGAQYHLGYDITGVRVSLTDSIVVRRLRPNCVLAPPALAVFSPSSSRSAAARDPLPSALILVDWLIVLGALSSKVVCFAAGSAACLPSTNSCLLRRFTALFASTYDCRCLACLLSYPIVLHVLTLSVNTNVLYRAPPSRACSLVCNVPESAAAVASSSPMCCGSMLFQRSAAAVPPLQCVVRSRLFQRVEPLPVPSLQCVCEVSCSRECPAVPPLPMCCRGLGCSRRVPLPCLLSQCVVRSVLFQRVPLRASSPNVLELRRCRASSPMCCERVSMFQGGVVPAGLLTPKVSMLFQRRVAAAVPPSQCVVKRLVVPESAGCRASSPNDDRVPLPCLLSQCVVRSLPESAAAVPPSQCVVRSSCRECRCRPSSPMCCEVYVVPESAAAVPPLPMCCEVYVVPESAAAVPPLPMCCEVYVVPESAAAVPPLSQCVVRSCFQRVPLPCLLSQCVVRSMVVPESAAAVPPLPCVVRSMLFQRVPLPCLLSQCVVRSRLFQRVPLPCLLSPNVL
ncbi:hypothetical protein C7M84_009579 [Penaeus vannamei]|uniref:Uncharacterized protein n=1 Tax=Penaeus vannamei TaxID=6689 RepID=A0A3R7MXJ6_PENVA|nr:hypothetical protein C7M84_009579 [Penaeus vannamei]